MEIFVFAQSSHGTFRFWFRSFDLNEVSWNENQLHEYVYSYRVLQNPHAIRQKERKKERKKRSFLGALFCLTQSEVKAANEVEKEMKKSLLIKAQHNIKKLHWQGGKQGP